MSDERPTLDYARDAVGRRQAELLASLTGKASSPAGFNRDGIARSAQSLRNKRRRILESHWPALVEALGVNFAPLFDAFATAYCLPAGANPSDDAYDFLRWLDRCNALPLQMLRVFVEQRARRGFPIQLLHREREIWLAIRVGRRRVRTFHLTRRAPTYHPPKVSAR